MCCAAPTPPGKGGKKPLDASSNLLPFIDLLSCCISFLLITAVWTQLARMDVSQKGQGAAGSTDEKPPEPTTRCHGNPCDECSAQTTCRAAPGNPAA